MGHTKVLIYRNPQFGRCPQCKSVGTLHRSRARSVYEQIVRKTSILKTYRCRECGWRGFRSSIVITKKSVRAILFYIFLVIAAAYIVEYILVKFAAK